MADSLLEKLRKRREALEEGDATGGESFDEDRKDKGNIRKKVEEVLDGEEKSKRRMREGQSTDSNQ